VSSALIVLDQGAAFDEVLSSMLRARYLLQIGAGAGRDVVGERAGRPLRS
jgi:hypothetical protein